MYHIHVYMRIHIHIYIYIYIFVDCARAQKMRIRQPEWSHFSCPARGRIWNREEISFLLLVWPVRMSYRSRFEFDNPSEWLPLAFHRKGLLSHVIVYFQSISIIKSSFNYQLDSGDSTQSGPWSKCENPCKGQTRGKALPWKISIPSQPFLKKYYLKRSFAWKYQ